MINSIVRNGELGGIDINPGLQANGQIKADSAARNLGLPATPGAAADIHAELRDTTPDVGADEFVDTDSDLLPDFWEIQYLGSLAADPLGDDDLDELPNEEELNIGTRPDVPDSDGDGLLDGWEWRWNYPATVFDDLVPVPLPYFEDFMNTDYPQILLRGQHGWTSKPYESALVNANGVVELLFGGMLLYIGDVSANEYWYSYEVKPYTQSLPAEEPTSNDPYAWFYFNDATNVVAYHGTQWVTNSSVSVSLDDWLIINAQVDFAAGQWSLYVGTNAVFENLLIPANIVNTSLLTLAVVSPSGVTEVNSIGLSTNRPFFLEPDNDGDDMPDAWEAFYGLDTNAADGHLDMDHDGLSNFEEYLYDFSPTNPDSDGDGFGDAYEVDNALDPLHADSEPFKFYEDDFYVAYEEGSIDGQNAWNAFFPLGFCSEEPFIYGPGGASGINTWGDFAAPDFCDEPPAIQSIVFNGAAPDTALFIPQYPQALGVTKYFK